MKIAIDPDRLALVSEFRLSKGAHESIDSGACVMELVSFVAREPWSDHPRCACPVLGAFMRAWNDCLPNNERNELLLPLVPKLVGTRGSRVLEERRSLMAADWLVRTYTPVWLRLAGLTTQAEALSSLPEITSMVQVPSIRHAIYAVRADVDAAWDASWGAARVVAGDAVWIAARVAAWATAGGAACDAAGVAARNDVWDDVWDAAWDTAWDAAGAAAPVALTDTRKDLQKSALALVERMIEARD